MAIHDFLLRTKDFNSLVALNTALPTRFKLIKKVDGAWMPRTGVNLDPIENLELKPAILDIDGTILTPAVLSTEIHYNIRVTDAWPGSNAIAIPDTDPDSGDDRLRGNKFIRWFKANGTQRTDTATRHPRSGRSDMRWFRWGDATKWVDIIIDNPSKRRRVWL